jgi:hypothetical protein
MNETDVIEFDCPNCGVHVYAAGLTEPPPLGQRCAHCQWLADIPDPVVREKLRASLIKIGAIDA